MAVGFNPSFPYVWILKDTVGSEKWIDAGALGGADSPIPTGKQIWLGSGIFFCEGKLLNYELRTNTAGQSTGTLGTTVIRGLAQSSPDAGDTAVDFWDERRVDLLSPPVASTGVEKLWLRVYSGSNASADFTAFLFYGLVP